MNTLFIKLNIFSLLVLISFGSIAQEKAPSISMNFGKGIKFTSPDSLFTLAIGGRIQSMFEAKREMNINNSGADFILRRCRLNFQGTAFDPRLSYRIQIGFSHGDITSSNTLVQNNLILRDAMFFYKASNWLRIGFGQTKLPGNRQRQVSSANLQLVERSIANNNFTLDRDKGIWFYTNFNINKAVIKTTTAISSGEGRIVSDKNGKLCFSSRIEFLPLGEFSHNGELIEADNEKEVKPKISIAGVYSYNASASRTMGQLGEYLYNSEKANIYYYGGDILFKYKGFSLEAELYHRDSDKGAIKNKKDTLLSNYVISGTTMMIQSGYFITKKNEIAVRFAQIKPLLKLKNIMPLQYEYVVGFSHYIKKHSLKLQSDLSYFEIGSSNNLVYRFSSVITF